MSSTRTWDSFMREYSYLKQCEKRLKEILALPDCNDCGARKTCKHVPKLGEDARINCFAHVGKKEDKK